MYRIPSFSSSCQWSSSQYSHSSCQPLETEAGDLTIWTTSEPNQFCIALASVDLPELSGPSRTITLPPLVLYLVY